MYFILSPSAEVIEMSPPVAEKPLIVVLVLIVSEVNPLGFLLVNSILFSSSAETSTFPKALERAVFNFAATSEKELQPLMSISFFTW